MLVGWHFTGADGRLGYNDGREVKLGETLCVGGFPILCHHGLHMSTHVADALCYGAGPRLWRVALGGKIARGGPGSYKLVGTERTALADAGDVHDLLLDVGYYAALRAIHNAGNEALTQEEFSHLNTALRRREVSTPVHRLVRPVWDHFERRGTPAGDWPRALALEAAAAALGISDPRAYRESTAWERTARVVCNLRQIVKMVPGPLMEADVVEWIEARLLPKVRSRI